MTSPGGLINVHEPGPHQRGRRRHPARGRGHVRRRGQGGEGSAARLGRCPRTGPGPTGDLAHIGRLVEANAEALARLRHPRGRQADAEALGEVREIVDTCDFFAGEDAGCTARPVPSEMPDKQLLTFRNPVGVVSVITAGNFPVAVPSWYLIPALLCGNTVLWKPAEYSAACGAALFDPNHTGKQVPNSMLKPSLANGYIFFFFFFLGGGGGVFFCLCVCVYYLAQLHMFVCL